jgi:Effector Associated Constant Component 1
MTDKPTRLLLRIAAGPDTDSEEVGELTRQLRQELLERDLDAVDRVGATIAPTGAKGDPVTLGTLLVTLAAKGGVLTTVINTIQSWLARQERHSVTVEIGGDKLVLSSASSEQEQQLIDAFINRHKGQ